MKMKYVWLTEFIVWLLIISTGAFLFFYYSNIKNNSNNTYYVFFDDVEGLVRGSGVRLMGHTIGHVKDVKIFENKVFVSFIVTENNMEIPKCATATIEFSGLGGSVSLELNPATASDTDNTKEEIIPSKSYRVQDYYDGGVLASQVLIDYYGSFGRNVTNEQVLKYKPYAYQSGLIKAASNATKAVNNEQIVIIRKLSENQSSKKEKSAEEVKNNE